jgi:hypothetical protein
MAMPEKTPEDKLLKMTPEQRLAQEQIDYAALRAWETDPTRWSRENAAAQAQSRAQAAKLKNVKPNYNHNVKFTKRGR